jgi:hypothetical protein
MPYNWEGFLIIQEKQNAELLNQGKGVDSPQPINEADGARCDLKFPDYQKAFR